MAGAWVQESVGDPHRRAAEGHIAFTWRLMADQGEEKVPYDFLGRRLVADKHPRQAHQRTRRAPRRDANARLPADGCQARRAAAIDAAGSKRRGWWRRSATTRRDWCQARGVALRVLSGSLSNFHDLAAGDATTALLINVITAVGQFQRDLQNELTAEGIAAAEAEGRYRGRPPALDDARRQEARDAFQDQGASIAALARTHGVSRAAVRTALAVRRADRARRPPCGPRSPSAVRTALADLLPDQPA